MQVEVSAREGIYLEATPRLARAVTERPIPDAEMRGAIREGREARPPAHTTLTALRATATVILYSQQMTADAKLLRDQHPEVSLMMSELAKDISEGRMLLPQTIKEQPILTLKEVKKQSEFIMSRRSEILAGIQEIDDEISTIPIGKERSQLEHDASRIKLEAAEFIPNAPELIAHTRENRRGYYQGVKAENEAEDGIGKEIKDRTDQEAGELAQSVGIDPDKFISRFDKARPVSQALADQWRKDELEDIQNNLTYKQATPQNKVEQLAQSAYDDLHCNALQTYRKAERELEAQAVRKKELLRIAKLIKEGRLLNEPQEGSLRAILKNTLNTSELNKLEAGNSDALRFITPDLDQQRRLSQNYLAAEIQNAEGVRKQQLTLALSKITNEATRDAELSQQRAVQARRKDHGLDL